MSAPTLAAPLTASAASREAPAESEKRGWLGLVLLIWAALYGLLMIVNAGRWLQFEFHDPDDQLRLQQVRDLLAGQGWFDLHQYRIDAVGGGVVMHWSRLVDLPIAAVMLLFRPLLGQEGAEMAALLLVPGLTLLAILALAAWIAVRMLPRAALPVVLLTVAFAVPVIVQVLPGRIDHHGWQIALALIAMAGFLNRDERRGGWITGAALATWMAISFEGVPLSAWIVAVTAIAALAVPEMRVRLVAAMQALAVVSVGLFAATRGGDLANHCDAIAPVHLAAFAWGAAAITASHRLKPQSRAALIAGLGVAAIGAVAIVAGAAPQCTRGSFDMLDPVVRSIWYDNVQEGKPVLFSSWPLAAQYALPPLIGFAAAIRLALRSEGDMRRWWLIYVAVMAGALAIGLTVARASSISGVMAALPLGWQLSQWLAALRRPPNPLLRVAELAAAAAVIFMVLLPVVPVLAVEELLSAGPAAAQSPAVPEGPCSIRSARAQVAALPPGGILAPLDMGPDLLINTDRAVLATGHHRGARAMRRLIDAFSGSPAEAQAIMRANDLRYLAICPSLQELDLYRKRAPGGFAAQLSAGNVPNWLEPIAMPASSGMQLWRRLD